MDYTGHPVIVPGWLGKPKGIKQILWERGLWKDSMTLDGKSRRWVGVNEDLSAKAVLANCEDFKAEEPELKKIFKNRGHILEMSPKGHPEMAGVGIEYSWGKSKYEWRRIPVEERKSKRFYDDLLKLLWDKGLLSMDRIRKYARKTRDYRRTYQKLNDATPLKSQERADIDKVMKKQKAHRSILSTSLRFLKET